MRVLIVDDSTMFRDRLASGLGEWSRVDLFEAPGAEEALAIARETRPDLVLLDLHMPGKGGLAVIAELKAISPSPVVIVMTWQATDHHRRRCLAMGADFFLDKACDVSNVLESVIASDWRWGRV